MCLAIATPSVVVVLYVSGYSHPQCGTVCVKYTCYNVHESREQGKSEQ